MTHGELVARLEEAAIGEEECYGKTKTWQDLDALLRDLRAAPVAEVGARYVCNWVQCSNEAKYLRSWRTEGGYVIGSAVCEHHVVDDKSTHIPLRVVPEKPVPIAFAATLCDRDNCKSLATVQLALCDEHLQAITPVPAAVPDVDASEWWTCSAGQVHEAGERCAHTVRLQPWSVAVADPHTCVRCGYAANWMGPSGFWYCPEHGEDVMCMPERAPVVGEDKCAYVYSAGDVCGDPLRLHVAPHSFVSPAPAPDVLRDEERCSYVFTSGDRCPGTRAEHPCYYHDFTPDPAPDVDVPQTCNPPLHRYANGSDRCVCGEWLDAPDVTRDVIEMVRDLAGTVSLVRKGGMSYDAADECMGAIRDRADSLLRARKEGL